MFAASETSCPDDALLRQFLLGQIADADAEPLERHLENCPSCVARLEIVPASDTLLEAARHGGETLSTPEPETVSHLIQRLCQTLSGEGGQVVAKSWSAATPTRTGRYRLLRQLGSGGMGTVYLAEDPELGRSVALKLPHFSGSSDVQQLARQRFLREARAAAAVRHAHVCPIHDVGVQDGTPFVVMAYIEGCSLAERLQRDGRFTDARLAVALAVQMAEGLAAVHDQGVIHRDLKPGNVLLDQAGDAYLTDFGLARWQEDGEHLTADGVVVGTPAYMAPEQFSDEFGSVTPQTDVYSLGVVLYQMLTGRLPFAHKEPMRLFAKILHDRPPSLRELRPDLDAALESLVTKAMARRPEDRFADARQLAAALRGWLNAPVTTAVAAPSPLPQEETVSEAMPVFRSRRRRWSWRAAGAFAGLLLVGGMVLTLMPKRDEAPRENALPQSALPEQSPLSGSIDVRVWKRANLAGPGRRLGPAVLPLHPGDEVRVEAELNRAAYLYIVWIDTAGKPLPIYPWDPRWNWPAAEKPVDRLSLPTSGNRWPIGAGEPGMETLLLLGRATPWPRDVDLRQLLADLPRPVMQHPASAVWFRDWEVVHNEVMRGPNLFDERRPADPLLRTQQILLERLQTYCDFSRSVSFANAGE